MKITHCQYNRQPVYYDLTSETPDSRAAAIEESEARYMAHDTRQKLEQLHDAVLALDALVIGLMMRGMK